MIVRDELVARALLDLPEGSSDQYPLRTRFVMCAQTAEAAAEEVLENIHRRGEPAEADAADLDLAIMAAERGLSAFIVLNRLLEELEKNHEEQMAQ